MLLCLPDNKSARRVARTLFVGRWLIMSQWAVLYMPNGKEPERFSSPDLPVVESKQIAISNLIKYALKKKLPKIQ